ncbi:MAG: type III-B CRISPR-associated protein Cas10/Cmr2, partial [Gemmataceae bacterium]
MTVSTHLLAISVGPVQEFIAAARRTRDLWFGSYLLSEISRAVAVAVAEHGKLIFPASAQAPNVANVILVELAAGRDPATIAANAKRAAQMKWREGYAVPVLKEYQGVIDREIWDDQVDDVIEFYAAWTPLDGNYSEARARVMRLLAGRKYCRDFIEAK